MSTLMYENQTHQIVMVHEKCYVLRNKETKEEEKYFDTINEAVDYIHE